MSRFELLPLGSWRLKSQIIITVLKLLSWLPFRLARALGWCVGSLLFLANSKSARVVQLNISKCFPQMPLEQQRQLSRERLRDMGVAIFETPGVWRRSAAWVDSKLVAVHGLELFREADAGEQGAIFLFPHQGNWEAGGIWVSAQTKITALYEPPKFHAVGEWILQARQLAGAEVVPTNVRGVAAVVKALKRGESTLILPDQQPPPSGGEFAPFYGIPARTMTLIYNLIQRSGCRAIFGAALRVEGGWELHFIPAEEAIYSADQGESLAALNRGVAQVVALDPKQYQWEYKRFRHQPDGSRFYPPGM